MDLRRLDERLAELHRGRDFILFGEVAAGWTTTVATLRRWGAGRVTVMATSQGAGDLPDCEIAEFEHQASSTISRAAQDLEARAQNPSDPLFGIADGIDPDRRAVVVTPPFMSGSRLLGRKVLGSRPRPWRRLEDKTTVDAVWTAAGLDTAPSAIVPPERAAETAERLANDLGTVWALDNSRGWHGAGEGTRWVPDVGAARSLADEWGTYPRVRVMPFLDGIPCSIHGIVTDDGVAATRPAEMLILRDLARSRFFYAGVATNWDPTDRIREQMRRAARSVGGVLAAEVGYRGGFGIDGVVTTEGFRPNELNTRPTAGLIRLAMSLRVELDGSEAPFDLLALERLIVDQAIDVPSAMLEELIVSAADESRTLESGGGVPVRRDRGSRSLGLDESGRLCVGTGESDAGKLEIGPIPTGSYVSVSLKRSAVDIGESMASRMAEALALASAVWDLDLWPLTPPPDLR